MPIPLDWTWSRLEALSALGVYDMLALRARIFILEQGPYLDPDGLDRQSWHLLVSQGVARSAAAWPGQGNRISAQAHLQRFYGRHGFAVVGEVYSEDTIPHIQMWRQP